MSATTQHTSESVLQHIEWAAEFLFPTCPKCHQLIARGEITEPFGREHLICPTPYDDVDFLRSSLTGRWA